jgi:hypothetical protein
MVVTPALDVMELPFLAKYLTDAMFVVVMDLLVLASAQVPLTSAECVEATTNALDAIVLPGLVLPMMNVVCAMEITRAVVVMVLPILARKKINAEFVMEKTVALDATGSQTAEKWLMFVESVVGKAFALTALTLTKPVTSVSGVCQLTPCSGIFAWVAMANLQVLGRNLRNTTNAVSAVVKTLASVVMELHSAG